MLGEIISSLAGGKARRARPDDDDIHVFAHFHQERSHLPRQLFSRPIIEFGEFTRSSASDVRMV